jgi:flagellar basal-body rod protein FlgB
MLNALTGSPSIDALEQILGFTESRHEVLVNNLANVDTPGYRMRDLSEARFHESLKSALAQRPSRPKATRPVTAGSGARPFEEVEAARQHIVFHDENNRSIERQVVDLTKNGMLHNMAVEILASQFELLHVAISERV